MSEELFKEYPQKTHMPFFDERLLVFCAAGEPVEQAFTSGGSIWETRKASSALEQALGNVPRSRTVRYRAWKLHYAFWNDRRPQRLATGLPAHAVECNPAFYWEDGQCHVSFTGGTPEAERLVYHLYEMSGPAIDRLGPPRRVLDAPTTLGFVSPRYVCFGRGRDLVLREKRTNEQRILECPLAHVYRVAFRADQPEQLLLTGEDQDGQPRTLLYDLATDETFEVTTPEPVYKAGLCGDRIVFAQRLGGEFEDRQLRHGTYRLERCTYRVRCQLPSGAKAVN
jgi:hypothetical protein